MTPRRMRGAARAESGAISGEFVAVVIVVAGLVAALVATPIASTVGDWGRYAVCSLFGGECERPTSGVPSGEPGFACERSSSIRGGDLNVSLGVDVERSLEYVLSTYSDGSAHLKYDNSTALGGALGGGVEVELHWGEDGLTLGGQASASAKLRFGEGDTHVFEGSDAEYWARQYRAMHAVSEAPADVVLGGRGGPLGRLFGGAIRLGNEALNRLPVVDGIEYREPDRRLVHTAGAVELEAVARGGLLNVEGEETTADIRASLRRAIGSTLDTQTNELTVYVQAETGVATEGRLPAGDGAAAWDATWSNDSLVAITFDEHRTPISAQVTTYRIDEADRDIAGVRDLREAFPDRRFATGTTGGGQDALATPSLYQVESRIDLQDPDNRDLLDRVLAGQALTLAPDTATDYAAEFALRPVHEAGETAIIEHDEVERRYGGDVTITPGLEVGAGGGYTADDRSVLDAWYFDEGLGRYAPWLSCTGSG